MFTTDRVEDPAVLWEEGNLLSAAVRANPRRYPDADPQWVEDRFWIWVHYVGGKIRRGEVLETLDSFAWMRSLGLAPLVRALHGAPSRGCRFREKVDPTWARRLAELRPRNNERAGLKECLEANVAIYRELRALLPQPVERRAEAEAAVEQYLRTV